MMPESSHPLNWNLDTMQNVSRETNRMLNHSPQIGYEIECISKSLDSKNRNSEICWENKTQLAEKKYVSHLNL